jgi:hypothetical protein
VKSVRLIPVLLLALTFASCGYRFQADPGSRFADPSLRVDLRPFANASVVPDAGRYSRGSCGRSSGAQVSAASTSGWGRITWSRSRQEIREDVVSHGADGLALEHRLTLVVNIRVAQSIQGRLLWKEEGLVEAASYFAGADFQYTESNRRAAIEEVCRRMARRISQTVRVIL